MVIHPPSRSDLLPYSEWSTVDRQRMHCRPWVEQNPVTPKFVTDTKTITSKTNLVSYTTYHTKSATAEDYILVLSPVASYPLRTNYTNITRNKLCNERLLLCA